MGRILKENATVPLFFAQTLVESLRDVGYNNTTSALCEEVDNAIQAGATEIRVYFRQSGSKGSSQIDAAVYDNGHGMAPGVLKVAMAFGGSTSFGSRKGIGRFGMGMKTAALSLSPSLEVYSWQEPQAYYSMTLDVEAIGRDRSNLVQLPDPTLLDRLPPEVVELFRRPLAYPTSQSEQDLFATTQDELEERLGRSGTIVYMPNCDRLTYAKAKTLVDHATKEMARVYRRHIADGLKLYVNNRLVEAFDPTYSMPTARHTKVPEISTKCSSLVVAKNVEIPVSEWSTQHDKFTIKIYKLPIEDWSTLSRKTLRNDLHVFDGSTISILRNEREVFFGSMPDITTRHSVTIWYRIEIEFPGTLDEAFGVATNKQGVRLKAYVRDAIKDTVGEDITILNAEIKRYQALQAAARNQAGKSTSETKATESDPFQMKPLDVDLTPEEQAQMDANLRGLAVSLKRANESDDEAFERIKSSNYIMAFHHDEYWPFYRVEHKYGRVILTINTAHPFFTELYEPIKRISQTPKSEDGDEEVDAALVDTEDHGPVVALELLLLSLARTQSRLSLHDQEVRTLLDLLGREWSETYRVQLTA
jgi:hypothetical protein